MSSVKDLLIVFEDRLDILKKIQTSLISLISEREKYSYSKNLKISLNILNEILNASSQNTLNFNYIYTFCSCIPKSSWDYLNDFKKNFLERIDDTDDTNPIYYFLVSILLKLNNSLKNCNPETNKANLYSKDYYTNEIKNLTEGKKKLLEEKEILKKKIESITKRNDRQNQIKLNTIEKIKTTLRDKELALNNKEIEIQEKNQLLKEKQKQEDAINQWNNKIKDTFKILQEKTEPIQKEYKRLKLLYWIYFSLTILLFFSLIGWGIYLCYIFLSSFMPLKWQVYTLLISPITISGGLLWACIFQMNRAQRQLVILAKHIHEVKYTEGLLLGINGLSRNIDDSVQRINAAMDKLLENHIRLSHQNSIYNEDSIIKEEKKEYLPIDIVLKLLNETRGLINKK